MDSQNKVVFFEHVGFWPKILLFRTELACFTKSKYSLPWEANMRKHMPPIGRPSLIKANVLCLGSNTNRVMYSFGILGSWWLKTFCKAISQSMVCFGTRSVNEFEMQWNSIALRFSSCLAPSSRGACSGRISWGPIAQERLVYEIQFCEIYVIERLTFLFSY